MSGGTILISIYLFGVAQGACFGWWAWRRPGLQYKQRERIASPQESTKAR